MDDDNKAGPKFRFKMTKDDTKIQKILDAVAYNIWIGVTDSKTGRQAGSGRSGSQPTNAELAYIHEFGSPVKNIPARPFLIPAIAAVIPQATKMLQLALKQDNPEAATKSALSDVGRIGVAKSKEIILAGDFIPLKAETIKDRIHRRNSSFGEAVKLFKTTMQATAGATDTSPLLDTKQLFQSLSWSLRKNKK